MAVIENEDITSSGGPDEELVRLAQQGDIETVLEHKREVGFDEIFDLGQTPIKHILVEGAPGIGKTSFALEICRKWASPNHNFFSRFKIALLIQLRDQSVKFAKTLADILPFCDDADFIASQLQATNGRGVLLIFDGWDEFPLDLQESSFVSSLIHFQFKKLYQSTILVTTRPTSSGDLKRLATTRLEILGFTQERVHEYFKENMNKRQFDMLTEHLKKYPGMEGSCYIPLNAAILVHMFLSEKCTLPTTRYEVFCKLILYCIAQEQESRLANRISIPQSSSLDDLPEGLKVQLTMLSELAYNGVTQDRVVFSDQDLEGIPSLGLLNPFEGFSFSRKSISYSFLHLSFQELLAAYHIAKMKTEIEQKQALISLHERSRLSAVLPYYAGFTKLKSKHVQDLISDLVDFGQSQEILLTLMNCFYETRQSSHCELITSKITGRLNFTSFTLSPVHCLSLGYLLAFYLSSETTRHSGDLILLLSNCGINDHNLSLLLKELSAPTSVTHNGTQLMVFLNLNPITYFGVKSLAEYLKNSMSIRELHLNNVDINIHGDGLLYLTKALQTNQSIQILNLGNNSSLKITEKNGQALVELLHINKTLTQLYLANNSNFSDSGASYISQGLRHNTTLTFLNLASTSLTSEGAEHIAQALEFNTSLEVLNISNNQILEIGISRIMAALQRNSTLQTLIMSGCGVTKSDIEAIKEQRKDNPIQIYP